MIDIYVKELIEEKNILYLKNERNIKLVRELEAENINLSESYIRKLKNIIDCYESILNSRLYNKGE